MRINLLIGAGTLLLVLGSTALAADIKIAYVDVQRALNDCSAGKKAKADFRVQIERMQSRLEREQSEVQGLKDELEKKGMLMQEDQRRNLSDEYSRKARDFERNLKDSKEELEHKDNEITGAIIRDLARVIRDLGEREGYTMVMEKGSILWGAPSVDITDRVIRAYDATGAKIGSLGEAPATSRASAPTGSNFGDAAARKSSISK